MEKSGKSLKL